MSRLTTIPKGFEANSSLYVKQSTVGEIPISVFQEIFINAGRAFFSGGGNKRWVIILVWSSEVFVVFPNFIRSLILSRRNRREETHILNFITNNYASFHLWWNEKYHQS